MGSELLLFFAKERDVARWALLVLLISIFGGLAVVMVEFMPERPSPTEPETSPDKKPGNPGDAAAAAGATQPVDPATSQGTNDAKDAPRDPATKPGADNPTPSEPPPASSERRDAGTSTEGGADPRTTTRPWMAVLWSFAGLAIGALGGFVFGFPKVTQSNEPLSRTSPAPEGKSAAATGYRLLMNTNLEQVSDWLTKIVVGLGLIELRMLPAHLGSCSQYVMHSIGTLHGSAAMAILLYFPICGFFGGYMSMRLYLSGAFSSADQRAQAPHEFTTKLEEAASGAPSTVPPGALPTEKEIGKAEKLGELALKLDEEALSEQVNALAYEYNRVRGSLRPGNARTERMQAVVNKMKALGFSVGALMPSLEASPDPGQRLVAIAALQVNPDPEHLSWLADRFVDERPFVAYQAAVALLAAAKYLKEKDLVRDALDQAEMGPLSKGNDTQLNLKSARSLVQEPSAKPPIQPPPSPGSQG